MSRRAPLLYVIASLVTIMAALAVPVVAQEGAPPDHGPEPGTIGEPVVPLADKRLYDMANLLDDGQEVAIESDARRLDRHGIPNVTVIRPGAMTPEEAVSVAAEIRQLWNVESRPGADDGLVILVTVSDTEEQRGIATTLSWGDAALPHFGVTDEVSADIQQTWLDRYIEDGHPYEGILFTLRRLIYHSIYEPAPQEPLTDMRASLGAVMSVAGAMLVAGALVLAGWRWATGGRRRNTDLLTGLALTWGVPVLAVAVFALSIAGRSGWGVTSALALLGVAAFDWIARDPRRTPARRVVS